MRKALLMVGAAALAAGAPALAKPGGGGGKPEKQHGGGGKAHAAERGGASASGSNDGRHAGPSGGQDARRATRDQRRAERAPVNAETTKSERSFAKAERKDEERMLARTERKAERRRVADAEKQAGKHEQRIVRAARRSPELRPVRYDDRRTDGRRSSYEEPRYAAGGYRADCPPGLARKGNGCQPPGQARKMLALGQLLPVAYYSSYNVPYAYQGWYQDTPDYRYRYDDSGYIYGVEGGSGLIESLIPLLGGGFGVGEILPSGYDAYNLPLSYRDDYADNDEALYRYGDDAIYQVDPQSGMIEAVVALLGGDLNVGQQLPSGYDTYNLPMDYRDQYQDSDEAMYRYADGNIYEVDPQSNIIEQIVASLT